MKETHAGRRRRICVRHRRADRWVAVWTVELIWRCTTRSRNCSSHWRSRSANRSCSSAGRRSSDARSWTIVVSPTALMIHAHNSHCIIPSTRPNWIIYSTHDASARPANLTSAPVAVWHSIDGVAHINEFTQRRAQLMGDRSRVNHIGV